MRSRIPALCALTAALLLPFAGAAEADYSYYPPEPNGVTLQVLDPVFSVQIDGGPSTTVTCSLQFLGKDVTMPYDAAQSACVYTWPDPLAPGSYQATLLVTAPGYQPISQNLQFSVAQGAVSSLPTESLTSIETLRIVNYVRAQEGLGGIAFDPALQAASQAHAQYFVQNTGLYSAAVSLHSEPDPAAPGYTGAGPSERDAAYAAIGGGNEVMSTDSITSAWSLVGLYDTTFHRFMLLDGAVSALGAGYAASPASSPSQNQAYVSDMTTLFSGTQPLAVAFPWNGAQNVPVSFGGEDPDPLLGIAPSSVTSGTTFPEAGYPVSVTFDPSRVSQVTVSSATLTGPGGQALETYLVDGQNYKDTNGVYGGESMGTSVALFPQAPLSYQTTYTADIEGSLTLKSGQVQPYSESFSFTTAPAPEVSRVFQDGGYVFVVGDDLENAYISSYQWLNGNATVGDPVFAGLHYLAYKATGKLTQVTVTDGATGVPLGSYNLSTAPFSDAGASAAFQYMTDGANATGLVEGFPDGTFRPDASVTQAQAMAMLYRAFGSPALPTGTQPAQGVPAYAASAVAWAEAQGILLPTDGFRFGAVATRAELAAWLMRAYGIPGAQTAPPFTDAASIPPAYSSLVAAAAADGIVSGYPDGSFRPDNPVTRGAFAKWVLLLAQSLQSPKSLF